MARRLYSESVPSGCDSGSGCGITLQDRGLRTMRWGPNRGTQAKTNIATFWQIPGWITVTGHRTRTVSAGSPKTFNIRPTLLSALLLIGHFSNFCQLPQFLLEETCTVYIPPGKWVETESGYYYIAYTLSSGGEVHFLWMQTKGNEEKPENWKAMFPFMLILKISRSFDSISRIL